MGLFCRRLAQIFENEFVSFTFHIWEVCIHYFFEALPAPLPHSSPRGSLIPWDVGPWLFSAWSLRLSTSMVANGRCAPCLFLPPLPQQRSLSPAEWKGNVEFQIPFWPTENVKAEGEKRGMVLYCCLPPVEDILPKKFSVVRPPSSCFFGSLFVLLVILDWKLLPHPNMYRRQSGNQRDTLLCCSSSAELSRTSSFIFSSRRVFICLFLCVKAKFFKLWKGRPLQLEITGSHPWTYVVNSILLLVTNDSAILLWCHL